jgi:hypothetical protein
MLGVGNWWMVTGGDSSLFPQVDTSYHPYLFTAHPSSALEGAARGGNRQVVTVPVPTRRGGAR